MKKLLTGLLFALLTLFGSATAEEASPLWYPQITADMPVISISTGDSNRFATAWVREDKLQGRIDYVDAAITVTDGERVLLRNEKAQVKVRGNWTLDYPKKSIRIKFSKKQSMLGLNENQPYKSWVLLAEWKDLSMLNSATALFLAHNILGADGYYCTDYRFVHLEINGVYWGVYLLAEQQEVNPGRVDIAENEPGDANRYTGYLMEYDAYFTEEAALPRSDPFFEVYHMGLTGEQYGYTIKSHIEDNRQTAFLRGCVRLIYRICYAAVKEGKHYTFNDKYTELVPTQSSSVRDTVAQVIDLPSLVDTYILNEIACNPDLGWSSFYLSLDMSEDGSRRLTFHAPWDFDSAFGIRSDYESSWGDYARYAGNPWLLLFVDEPWFQEMVKARWAELTAMGLPEQTLAFVRTLTTVYAADFTRNYDRWPTRITEGNHELVPELNRCRSQQEAADYLYDWLSARFNYLNYCWK
ncbi:MAG: CotH kinase family protein [Clostridia bacterium]|nr:CotH kinase family protein [Clostridia bacterium]